MSEKIVIYRANQELQADDLNNMQAWMQAGLDHVVYDAIEAGKGYAGFTLTKSTSTQVSVAVGRLYDGGEVYARESVVTLDVYNDLPIATKRYLAVVAWGQTVEENIEPRNYLINAETGQAEPQSVAMRETRYCNINYIKGTESADPQYPSVEATVTLIGYVLCDPSGIVSVAQSTDNQLDNLSLVATRMAVLETWRGILAGMVDTLRTDLANLARGMLAFVPIAEYQKLVNIVAQQGARIGALEKSVELISGLFLFQGRDCFLDDSLTDTTTLDGVAYSATINEGLRFPGGTADWTGSLALLNPSEPLVDTASEVAIPKPSGSRVRYDCSFPHHDWIEHRILAHATYHSGYTAHHLWPSRWRHRCGPHFIPSPPATVWWHESYRDPCGHILAYTSETWENKWIDVQDHHDNDIKWPRYCGERFKHFWRDWVHLPHWDKHYADYSHSGNHMAQTFFNAQDGWLNGITVFLMKPSYGALNVLITGCDEQGGPDHENHTLRRVVLDQAAVTACVAAPIYAGDIHQEEVIVTGSGLENQRQIVYREMPVYVYPCRIPITPVFLRAGQHYAFHLDSTFDHYFAVSEEDECYQVHQGHVYHYNGSHMACHTDGPLSMRFKLHYCTWGRWGGQQSPGGQLRYEVNLQPLLLAGGIGSVDVLADAIVPDACDLSYEVQVGGVWKPFAADPLSPSFAGAPTQLPFRVVMSGTTDLMPGVSFDESQVTLTSAAAGTFHHYSDEITCASSSCVKVVAHMIGFAEANHELDCSIHYNGSPAHLDANTEADHTEADGTTTRTFTFNTTGCTAFKVELHGTSNHTGGDFIVSKVEWFTKAT